MNPIHTEEALGILQHHSREVAEHQHALELSTNNILTSQRLEVIELEKIRNIPSGNKDNLL